MIDEEPAIIERKREGIFTSEEQYKFLCKWMVDNGNRQLSEANKELIKQAIDKAKSPEEIVLSILALLPKNQ